MTESQNVTSFLTSEELAARWGKATGTIRNWRSKGRGPAFIKIGGSVFYRQQDVEAFETAQVRNGDAA